MEDLRNLIILSRGHDKHPIFRELKTCICLFYISEIFLQECKTAYKFIKKNTSLTLRHLLYFSMEALLLVSPMNECHITCTCIYYTAHIFFLTC